MDIESKNIYAEQCPADAKSCGNYLDQNLPMAKYEAKKYYDEVLCNLKEENLIYPN